MRAIPQLVIGEVTKRNLEDLKIYPSKIVQGRLPKRFTVPKEVTVQFAVNHVCGYVYSYL